MELMELYNQIHNPIDDISVIEKLINAYANSLKGFGGYYGQLTKTVQKNTIKDNTIVKMQIDFMQCYLINGKIVLLL